MSRKRGVRVIVLVEDRLLERFARHVLQELGFARREIRVATYTAGKGSAKQHIDKQYPEYVRQHRSSASHQNVALLVGTDADQLTVKRRFAQLESALQSDGINARKGNERIVIWVPKWSIETWIQHLLGKTVDENTSYKHPTRKKDFKAVAKEYVNGYRQFKKNPDSNALASLGRSYEETVRIE